MNSALLLYPSISKIDNKNAVGFLLVFVPDSKIQLIDKEQIMLLSQTKRF